MQWRNLQRYGSIDKERKLSPSVAAKERAEKRAENYKKMQQLMNDDSIGIWVTHGVKTPAWTTEVDPVFSPDGVILPWLITSSEK